MSRNFEVSPDSVFGAVAVIFAVVVGLSGWGSGFVAGAIFGREVGVAAAHAAICYPLAVESDGTCAGYAP